MLSAERNQQLRRLLFEQGSLRVSEQARRFGVSEETIRRDIKRLSAEGLVDPVFGGAVLKASPSLHHLKIPPVSERHLVEEQAKDAIGAAAAHLVQPGQAVIIDAGTTTLSLARHLCEHPNLTIVTNSIPVAQRCADLSSATTYVVGGRLVPGSLSTIGPDAEHELAQISADWAFIGAAAVDIDSGFTSADPYEAQVKRAMIKAARKTVILVDHSKFGSRRFASFARAEDIDYLVSTEQCPKDAQAWLQAAGVTLTLCPVT
ncbi:DeoR/GlpR family DNA-binding transcription regulator [Microvirga subterranea]|uniref:DeoR family transcriptional regulator n=1 Tax=Microvirga subterranea TaxID=186651 RepID=A0A370H2P4_9HYPH|nr:DeoR/GlpR family DNA-binding transcription regulator [Microvirga subterranea]RDI50495.1 DeoR family transcriptional regulator [Microvirga subterranea]